MKRQFGALVMIAALFSVGIPQAQTEFRRKVFELADSRDNSGAIRLLVNQKATDPKAFESGDHDYLLARMAEADGQIAVALQNYQSVVTRGSSLSPYALAQLSVLARSTGNLFLEHLYLQQLQLLYPENPLAAAAFHRLASSSFETGNYAETIRILTTLNAASAKAAIDKPRQLAVSRERQSLLGNAFMRGGQREKAREIFTRLLDETPNPAQADDHAQTAAKGLDLLDGGSPGKKAPDLDESEHFRRANIYQFNRDFTDARLHYEAIIARFSTGAADAIFQIGRGYAQSADHAEALKWYERILERYGESPIAKDALLQLAASYGRVGKSKEAISRYQTFIERYPTDEKLDRAYLNIVDILRDQGADQDALKWCGKTAEAFKGKAAEAVAIFTEARIYIARNEWQPALAALERLKPFSDLGGATIPGGTNTAEVSFLKALILEEQKRYREAVEQYLAIRDGRGEYYGWRATERLRAIDTTEEAKPLIAGKTVSLKNELTVKNAETRFASGMSLLRISDSADVRANALQNIRTAAKAMPKYATLPITRSSEVFSAADPAARRLIELGCFDDVVDEFGDSQAELFIRAGRADLGLAIVEPLWKKVAADHPIELIPREQLRLLYPAVFADEVARYSAERGVDPRLMMAIMRQESKFQPDAKSYAAARGLMQFISTTSTKVAGELGHKGFSQDDLYHPSTSILFGSQYVAGLFKLFPDQNEAVVASYNGGDDNMKRWLARSRSNLPDRYVPEIMFTQTKDYVYKVMANYRMYKYLYDENLKPHDD
jgi:soluble lytic murein transglycosylase